MTPAPVILAHAFGARYDLPIPLILFVLGGAAVVVLSFLVAERRDVVTVDGVSTPDVTPRPGDSTAARWTGGISVGLLGLLVAAGLLGSQVVAENILPTVFWLIVWIIVPLTCGLLGNWTGRVNPFAELARLGDRPGLRATLLGDAKPVAWRLGWWPAAGLFFLGACGELIFNLTATLPRVTAEALALYGLLSLAGGLVFGPAWLQRGELFSVLFDTWGRLGYFRFGAPGRRRFAGGLDVGFERSASRTTFVLLLLVSVNYDGLLATPQWTRHVEGTLGLTLHPTALETFRTASFLLLALLVAGVLAVFAHVAASAAGLHRGSRAGLAGLLPSMLPIAFGYLLAHNVQYVLVNGQLLAPLIGNPIGKPSWPVHLPFPFNDSFEVHANFVPSAFYWYLSVVVIVAVHVAAVVIAHRHLRVSSADRSAARRGEYRWLVAMVAYTMVSLWLLAQPLVTEAASARTSARASPLGDPVRHIAAEAAGVLARGAR